MDKMWWKSQNRVVDVFAYDVDHKNALIYDTNQASRSNGNGWLAVPVKQLIPAEYANPFDGSYMSKTERNRLKEELTMVDALWECTDGTRFYHDMFDEAIERQRKLDAGEVIDPDPFEGR